MSSSFDAYRSKLNANPSSSPSTTRKSTPPSKPSNKTNSSASIPPKHSPNFTIGITPYKKQRPISNLSSPPTPTTPKLLEKVDFKSPSPSPPHSTSEELSVFQKLLDNSSPTGKMRKVSDDSGPLETTIEKKYQEFFLKRIESEKMAEQEERLEVKLSETLNENMKTFKQQLESRLQELIGEKVTTMLDLHHKTTEETTPLHSRTIRYESEIVRLREEISLLHKLVNENHILYDKQLPMLRSEFTNTMNFLSHQWQEQFQLQTEEFASKMLQLEKVQTATSARLENKETDLNYFKQELSSNLNKVQDEAQHSKSEVIHTVGKLDQLEHKVEILTQELDATIDTKFKESKEELLRSTSLQFEKSQQDLSLAKVSDMIKKSYDQAEHTVQEFKHSTSSSLDSIEKRVAHIETTLTKEELASSQFDVNDIVTFKVEELQKEFSQVKIVLLDMIKESQDNLQKSGEEIHRNVQSRMDILRDEVSQIKNELKEQANGTNRQLELQMGSLKKQIEEKDQQICHQKRQLSDLQETVSKLQKIVENLNLEAKTFELTSFQPFPTTQENSPKFMSFTIESLLSTDPSVVFEAKIDHPKQDPRKVVKRKKSLRSPV